MPGVRGRRVLIVEDEYLLAMDLCRYFKHMGAEVLGPAGDLETAREEVAIADAAVLDIDLNGEQVFSLADELASRGVPFVFFTGRSDIVIPYRLRHTPYLLKPAEWSAVFEALFPQNPASAMSDPEVPDDVLSVLPKLRLSARLMMGDAGAADRLVALTLEKAIESAGTGSANLGSEAWLCRLLEQTYHRWGFRLLH